MVWGCGTFGQNFTDLKQFFTLYCPICSASDLKVDTSNKFNKVKLEPEIKKITKKYNQAN